MNCDCPECQGTGEIVCHECNGSGVASSGSLLTIDLHVDHPEFDKLEELQNSALLVVEQRDRLNGLLPHCKEKHDRQCDEVVASLEKKAEKILKEYRWK